MITYKYDPNLLEQISHILDVSVKDIVAVVVIILFDESVVGTEKQTINCMFVYEIDY